MALAIRSRLSDAICDLITKRPDVFINIHTLAPEQVTQRVMDGSVDVGITALDRPIPELTVQPLAEEEMWLYCGAKHPLFKRPDAEITPEVLKHFPRVESAGPRSYENAMHIELAPAGARAATLQSCLMLVLTGQYLGLMPRDFASSSVIAEEARPLRPSHYACPIARYAITRRNAPANVVRDQFLLSLRGSLATVREGSKQTGKARAFALTSAAQPLAAAE